MENCSMILKFLIVGLPLTSSLQSSWKNGKYLNAAMLSDLLHEARIMETQRQILEIVRKHTQPACTRANRSNLQRCMIVI